MARWLWLGTFFFLSLPALVSYEQYSFNLKEAHYSSPVISSSGILTLRSDSYGKGFFGASRNGRRTHAGVDITLPVGNPVLAAKSGRVFFAGDDKGYGHYIELHHPDGLSTRYAHLSEIKVNEGQWISQGDTIGLSGKTGNAINPHITPHLHFEIRYRSSPLDPQSGLMDPKLRLKI